MSTAQSSGQLTLLRIEAGTVTSRRWWALTATASASTLVWLNATDINVALPDISKELLASLDQLQWMATAFMLAGFLIVATGRFADIYGRRRMFLVGLGLIALASIPAALAESPMMLIACRALMGVGGALVLAGQGELAGPRSLSRQE